MREIPPNLTIVSEEDFMAAASKLKIVLRLAEKNISSAHFTNGTYAAPADVVVPTTLAGFQFIVDQKGSASEKEKPALIVAVNSDESMETIMAAKRCMGLETTDYEDQTTRAKKIGIPLALQFPDRKVAVVFYNEETPNKLYEFLRIHLKMETLHKWGYGTDPNAGVIEGAELFGKVYAFPLPKDKRPLCHDITRKNNQKGTVIIVNLRRKRRKDKKTYITENNLCQFPLNAAELMIYGERKTTLSNRDVLGLGFQHS